MIHKSCILIFVILTSFHSAFGQFGNLGEKLKKKASKLVEEKIVEKTDEKRSEYDTSSLNYAIAFLDKSESFENKQEGEGLIKTANFLMKEDKERTEKEKARDMYEFGRLNYNKRRYKIGEVYLTTAAAAYELMGEQQDPVYLKTLGTLGLLYSDMGRFEGAENFTKQALDGWENTLGASSAGYAAESNNEAVLLFKMGKYNEAEKKLLEAKDLVSAAEGPKSVPYALALNNLGILYQYMGRTEEALDLLNQCLKIADKELREKSGTYLQLMTNKALILQENNQYAEAEKVYKEALDLQTSRLKLNRKSDPDYAHMLNNLASLYLKTDREDDAENLLKESLEIYKKKFGEIHPSTATAQADLGNLYRYQGKFDAASTFLVKALSTRRSTLGENHPNTVQAMEDLAVIRWKQGNAQEAADLYAEVMDYSLDFINDFFPPMSEAEKTMYWEQLKNRFFRFYNFAFANADSRPDLVSDALNYRLATKGLLLSATTKIKNTILSSGDTELVNLYNQWQDQKRSLATYYSFSKEELSEQKINLDSLEDAANKSERLLSEKSSAFADAFVSGSYDYQEIIQALKSGEAIVELIQYPKYETTLTEQNAYAGLILTAGKNDIELVLFENGNDLDEKYYSLYKNLIKQKVSDNYSYANYWQPIDEKLGTINTLFFSPDGVYSQINPNTIKKPSGSYLVEEMNIHIIGSPLDIVSTSTSKSNNKEAFLVGFPEYGSDEIVPLPGTKKEVQAISASLKGNRYNITELLQKEATESAIKRVSNPKLMHVATHGFFLEDVQSTGGVFGVQIEYARNNPLLRSGLMLAGVNQAVGEYGGQSFDEEDNGILTAYEAMNLSLNTTDLVVLSACETGVGDVKSGEGVYGLQRAFMVAGARKLVMSLWKVDDAATQQLMSGFYDLWINKNMQLEKAFRQAQLNLMKTYSEPYYWGAFVMVE